MSTDNQSTGGANIKDSVNDDKKTENQSNDQPDDQKKSETVSREAYEKLLGEKKKRDADLADIKSKLATREEGELKAKGEAQKLADLYKGRLDETSLKLKNIEDQLVRGSKLRSVLSKVGGEIDEQYWGLIDLEKVILTDDGTPDELSVEKLAKEINQKYSAIVSKPTKGNIPNDAHSNKSNSLTYNDWLKLPSKEMKARMKELKK